MGREQIRLGVWTLAILTCFAIFGDHTAYAWEHQRQARVMAGGHFFHNDPGNIPGGFSDRVSFGINGRCESPTGQCAPNGITPTPPTSGFTPVPPQLGAPAPKGNFEYFNRFTGLKARGKITDISFGTVQPDDACAAFGDPGLIGKPSAIIQGKCNDGQCTSFQMEVVDGDDSSPNVGDWVCNVNVQGYGKMHTPSSDSEPAAQLIRGDVEVRPNGN